MAHLLVDKPLPGADDFEIFFSEPSVLVGSEVWRLYEWTMLDGMRFAGLGKSALAKHAKGESLELITLLAGSYRRDALRIAGVSNEAFAALIAAWQKINRDWLNPKPVVIKQRTERWANIVQNLIEHGHSLPDIRTYTFRQVTAITKAITRLECARRIATMTDINLAQNGGKETDKHMKRLQLGYGDKV